MKLNGDSQQVSIATEINTEHISEIYKRFALIVGESNWKKRVIDIKSEIKGNKFLRDHLYQENLIAVQFENLRALIAKFGGIPQSEINNQLNYPALGFSSQILSIIDSSSREFNEKFLGRVQGAFRNPTDMRALRLELSAATHFTRRSRKIHWPELTQQGSVDLFIEDVGPYGLEVECKSISEDKGRKIPKRAVLDFYGLLWPQLHPIRHGLSTGLSAVLTVPDRLPNDYKSRLELAKQFGTNICGGKNAIFGDGTQIRVSKFELSRLQKISIENPSPREIRVVLDDVTSTSNRQTMLIRNESGGALALTVQSAKDDSLMKSIFDTLSDSAARQFKGTLGGMFFTGFHGLSDSQLLSVAGQDRDATQTPTALRYAVSNFLASNERDHIVGIGFMSDSGLRPHDNNVIELGGAAYYFPKRESPHWSEDFSGLFSWS
jgi:hypothetical protein